MKSCYTPSGVGARYYHAWTLPLFFYCLFGLTATTMQAQILVNPAGDGGFNNGSSFAANNWSVLNSSTATSIWQCGATSQTSAFGTRAAFVSDDGGTTWTYTSNFVSTVTHLYRTVSFPVTNSGFTLEFDWRAWGETSKDFMLVSLVPDVTPLETTYSNIDANDRLPSPAIHLAKLQHVHTKQHAVINIPQQPIGNCLSPVTWKLVFTWVNNANGDYPPPAIIDNVSLVINNDVQDYSQQISHPADVCANGSNPTWVAVNIPNASMGTSGIYSISGSPSEALVNILPGFAVLDLDKASPGRNIIKYTYRDVNGCVSYGRDTIEVYETPKANLKNTIMNCVEPNARIDLRAMFQGMNSQNGTFTATAAGNPAITYPVDSIYLIAPPGGGCFDITYNVPDPLNCVPGSGPVSATNTLRLTTRPKPDFEFSTPEYVCSDGVPVLVTITRTSTGQQPELDGDPYTGPLTVALDAPDQGTRGAKSYEFCLVERNVSPSGCIGVPALCYDSICKTIVIYNDGNGCGTSGAFVSECFPDVNLTDQCPVVSSPNMEVSCGIITIPGFNVVEARLENKSGVIFCDEDHAIVEFQGSIPGVLGDVVTGGPTVRELGGVATEVICDVITFSIPLGPFGSIDPLPLGPFEEICDQTITQFIFDYVADVIGADGGGGYVVADTDGDGAFDQVLADYYFPGNGIVDVPNNVNTAKGTISVRNVTSWPSKPNGACGQVNPSTNNLLDLIPIGLIPVVGAMVEAVLEAASCNIAMDFSDAETVEIPVINTTPPQFANCNSAGYVFSDAGGCNATANWSVPLAYDGCNGELLNYKGYTSNVTTTYFSGPVSPVTVTTSGIYQTAGPLPGSDLPVGTYTVTYTAYSCGAIEATCSFPVVISATNPTLVCPANMVVKTDVDMCTAMVSGLAPRQGPSCASVLNYAVDFPVGTTDISTNTPFSAANAGTANIPDGTIFPLGVSTVTYTLLTDLNADGDASDPGETQTCNFTVTVVDGQKPVAACQDVEVQLNNTGQVTVYAVNQNNGSAFINGGSYDNCDTNPTIEIAAPGGTYGASVSLDCDNVGSNLVNLRITDDFNNAAICIANIVVREFFEGVQMTMNLPELCLEANNPVQFDFANYLNITLPNGQTIKHNQVLTNAYLGDAQGFFGISAFVPHAGSPSNNPGSISADGIYTPGTGSGYVTVAYVLALPGVTPPNGNTAQGHCFTIIHTTFELRQPLQMASPECACVMENKRIVDLGIVSGGLEPYTIHYGDGVLDVNGDGTPDDIDGQYTYDGSNGFNINDFTQDLGELRIVYNPFSNWSIKIVDARGCEIYRSGSCDNADLTGSPTIVCPVAPPVLTTEALACESQYSWQHNLPHDNCAVVRYNYQITNPDGTVEGPFVLDALLNLTPASPLFTATYEFQLGTSVVRYYAEDAVGNTGTCSFQVTVVDNDAPYFINCPYPPVVQNAESGHCDAYVNFALPLAEDNCSVPVVTQIDNSGLTTGDRFPVGTTIMYFEAVDVSGNKDTCQVKVIVNDYWQMPSLTCPANVTQNNDPWECGAVVNNIAPQVDGPCESNYGITYTIYADAALTQVKDCGVNNASGEFFDKGDTWVKYTVKNQPLLMITEVTQSGATDRIEIANLGPADIDISCLEIKRVSGTAAANQTIGPVTQLPSMAPSILPVGGVRVFNFSFNGAANLPACYTISYMGTTFDEVATNGYAGCNGFSGALAGGDVIRKCEDDTDNAADWALAQNCYPLTIGSMNPDLEVMPDNGTQTSLQSILPNEVSCVFKVTVLDAEDPFCGKLGATTTYTGGAINTITTATCNRSTLTVPNNDCIIARAVLNLTGTANPSNSTITLISPKGLKVPITALPSGILNALYAQKASGTWTLDVVPNAGSNVTVTGWSLAITCMDKFNLADQTLPNDAGVCGASFTWTHPYFVDNCFSGTISVAYTTSDADCTPTGGQLSGVGGFQTTAFFCVGTTNVTYTLTDAAGNVETCGFKVKVNDVEKPLLTCPQNMTINLNGGECGAFVNYAPASASDNCAVIDTLMDPPSGSWFAIGNHVVKITVTDEAGNTATCTFTVNIVEHVPSSSALTCNDLEHISLDASCVYTINADAALEGDDYHCYDDYVIVITNNLGQPVGNTFTAANIGKVYKVTVTDPETGNSCWTTMKIEDKLAPALTCPPNITVACSESLGVAHTGNVSIQDCTTTSTQIEDNVLENGECGSPRQIITRAFFVTDAWNNQASCVQTITVTPFNLADLVFPADVTINCESAYLNPSAVQPVSTGRPSINGAPIGNGSLCSASVGYTDERLDICTGSYEIIRTWKVANTCLPLSSSNPVTYAQRIRVKDFGGPQFACPGDITVSTDPNSCCSTAALPDMIIAEGCSDIVNLEARVSGIDAATGNYITFTVPGYLTNFPGNNLWNPDTLANFDYTQCIPKGSQLTVRYTASDQCGNTSSCQFQLTVADLVPPVVACDEWTQVALGLDGMAFVNATTFDDGSLDNCGPVFFKARRMFSNDCQTDTLFHDQVKFCCSDIGDTIMVVLRVYDQAQPAGTVALHGTAGNYNDCMIQALVEDKIKPTCSAPANVTVDCESFDPSLWAYGQATATDNCCIDTINYNVVLSQFDSLCNRGTITRRWTAVDCGGNTSQCTQRVIVNYTQDYYVKFPADRLVSTCDGTGNYGAPEFYGEDCELLATSFVDEIFTVVPDACFKIERTWTVINWCTYTPNGPCTYVPNPNPSNTANAPANLAGVTVSAPGNTVLNWSPTVVKINPTDPAATNYSTFWSANVNCYQYKQIIKIYDTQDPSVLTPTDSLFCDYSANDAGFWNNSYWYDPTIASHDLCEGDANIQVTGTDACSGALLNFRYLLFLDLDNDGTMETVVNSVNPPGVNNVQFNNANTPNYAGGESRQFDFRAVPQNQKWGWGLQVDAADSTARTARVRWFNQLGQNAVPQLPYGTHKIKWFIEDGCGNEYVYEKTFTVKDCKKPTVVCLNGLSVNLMNTSPAMVQLWASDFLQYTEDNCTPSAQLKIAIRSSGTGTGFPTNPDGTPQTGVQFDCNDLGTQLVELWSIDKAGNADFCETYVLIQDNMGVCGPNATIAGSLATDLSEGVENATVELNGMSNGIPQYNAVFTDVSGDYWFSNALPMGSDYTVTPTMEIDPLNGVNTFDLILISRHILGLEPLNTPYKLISADANKSGTVTTFDVVELRKLILGTYTELPNNSSWRFIEKAQVFTDAGNPFADVIRENISVAQVQASALGDDFVATKIGDVDNSAVPNQLVASDDRTNGTLLFDVEDRQVKAGEVFEVTFKSADRAQGYQFTMNLTNLEVVRIEPGAKMTMDNFGVFADAVTTSADGTDGQFSITFRAKAGGQLSKMISVSSRITKAVAFDQTGSKAQVAFRFNNGSTSTIAGLGFELYQNAPNPWISKTQIGFHLPEAAAAMLRVYDASGRTVYTAKGNFGKGYNAFTIDRTLVDGTGALYYKVETATDSGVKQMIQVK